MSIKNLAFKGGGVLGIAYAGALQVLEEKNILQQVEKVAGTSAGAITAALVSLNYTAKEITSIVAGTNFKDFEDHKDFLRLVTKYGIYKGDALLEWIRTQIENKGFNGNATFTDFKNKGTKDLSVFASDLNVRSVKVFSYSKTPNVIVAEAIRASMSIPFFFDAWTFSNNIPNNHVYVDGGLLYNYPITYFDVGGMPNEETLGFYLTDLYNVAVPIELGHNEPIRFVKSIFETLMNSQEVEFEYDNEEQHRSVEIDNLGISATDFDIASDQQDSLLQSGRKYTTAFLEKKSSG